MFPKLEDLLLNSYIDLLQMLVLLQSEANEQRTEKGKVTFPLPAGLLKL